MPTAGGSRQLSSGRGGRRPQGQPIGAKTIHPRKHLDNRTGVGPAVTGEAESARTGGTEPVSGQPGRSGKPEGKPGDGKAPKDQTTATRSESRGPQPTVPSGEHGDDGTGLGPS